MSSVITKEEFLTSTLQRLEELTGIQASLWSRYFNKKKLLSEGTIRKAAEKLNMTPSELFEVVEQRRLNPVDNRYKSVNK